MPLVTQATPRMPDIARQTPPGTPGLGIVAEDMLHTSGALQIWSSPRHYSVTTLDSSRRAFPVGLGSMALFFVVARVRTSPSPQ